MESFMCAPVGKAEKGEGHADRMLARHRRKA
jgi:hypothetical protein